MNLKVPSFCSHRRRAFVCFSHFWGFRFFWGQGAGPGALASKGRSPFEAGGVWGGGAPPQQPGTNAGVGGDRAGDAGAAPQRRQRARGPVPAPCMYLCIYVFMYLCIYVFMHLYIYVCIYVFMYLLYYIISYYSIYLYISYIIYYISYYSYPYYPYSLLNSLSWAETSSNADASPCMYPLYIHIVYVQYIGPNWLKPVNTSWKQQYRTLSSESSCPLSHDEGCCSGNLCGALCCHCSDVAGLRM